MTKLLEMKDQLIRFYSKYENYLFPAVKFVIAFVLFATINHDLGFMAKISTWPVALVLAVVCAILPVNAIIWISALLVLADMYALSMEVAVTTLILFAALLIAGVLVSSLGAVMDVAVSLTAALMELVAVDPSVTARQVMKSGFNIGKDMIGTMSNTLILAFAGTALNTMLVLTAYGVSRTQFISSDYLAIELAQGLSATIGVILTVPITTGICAAMRISHR